MLYVINNDYGGFEIPKELNLDKNDFDTWLYPRENSQLIEWVKAHQNETDLAIVEIPDNATDWMIIDNDGWETMYYVVDGKLHAADPIDNDEEDDE